MEDEINAAAKRISFSIIIGSLLIALSILISSKTGGQIAAVIATMIVLLFIVGVIGALVGTGAAKVVNQVKRNPEL
ncbi:MAG: hypothetical protein JXR23_09660 [Pontiellaceae bacterium]|nr:hypothetical protein [Pontiellaceae bacterium]